MLRTFALVCLLAMAMAMASTAAAASTRPARRLAQMMPTSAPAGTPAPVTASTGSPIVAPTAPQAPDPYNLTAIDLRIDLVSAITKKYGQGHLYSFCRIGPDNRCNDDATCCGFLGGTTAAKIEKIDDTCVRKNGECPRTYPGWEGAPCGPDGFCHELVGKDGEKVVQTCCKARPYLGGRTWSLIPTCQRKGSIVDEGGMVIC